MVLLCVVSACSGEIMERLPGGGLGAVPSPRGGGADGGVGNPSLDCTAPEPGASPLRRLTHAEYDNTVRDLLGDGTRPAQGYAADANVNGFDNDASTQRVSPLLAEQYILGAEAVAARAVKNLAALLPCSSTGTSACAQSFIRSFGRRAYRRPLEPAEVTDLQALFTAGNATRFQVGIQRVLEAVLQSPSFLYRLERDSPGGVPGQVAAVGGYELATRLSYFLWGTTPDEALLSAAEAGQFRTAADVATQVKRMMADPRAHASVASFHAEWLELAMLDSAVKDASFGPAFAKLQPLFREETRRFIEEVVWNGDGRLATLLAAPFTFANADLAVFYGLTGVTGPDFQKVALDSTQRAGVLTQGALLSALAKPDQGSPVQRGKFVREQLLCQSLPPPPDNVNTMLPEPGPGTTTRQRFEQHSSNPACSGCHRLMDPVGLGFENFDAIGGYRAAENGFPVDASGELFATDVDGKFVGASKLAGMLAQSQAVSACVIAQWFRYAHGRLPTSADACTLQALGQRFSASGGRILDLASDVTQTDAFLLRHPGGTP